VTSYRYTVERLINPFLGHHRLVDLDYDLLTQWVNTLKVLPLEDGQGLVSSSTIHGAHRVLKAMLQTAVKTHRLSHNPARGIPLPARGKPQWHIITQAELDKLLLELDEGTPQTLVLCAALTGMRWSELAGLEWRHVRFGKGVISVEQSLVEAGSGSHLGVPKSLSSIREIPMPTRLSEALLALQDSRDEVAGLVFVSDMGKPLRRSNFSRQYWKPAQRAAGLDNVRFHDLRHSYVSWLMEAGVDPITVRDLAGHDSIVTTQLYSHTSAQRKRSAIDRLFGETG
jgi:integrase